VIGFAVQTKFIHAALAYFSRKPFKAIGAFKALTFKRAPFTARTAKSKILVASAACKLAAFVAFMNSRAVIAIRLRAVITHTHLNTSIAANNIAEMTFSV